jgi:TonB family protein
MSSIVSTPSTSSGSPSSGQRPPARRRGRGSADGNRDVLVPHILLQLEDDLERSHRREAVWISIIVHLFAVMFLLFTPKLFPGLKGVVIANPADLMRNKQLTYLDMPPDEQTPPKQVRPDAKLSDKNRIAESRHPTLDQKTIEELRKAGPPQPPGQQSPPAQQSQASPQGIQAPQQPVQQAQASPPPVQDPRLALPQQQQQQGAVPDFRSLTQTPGQVISQAARSTGPGRSAGSFGGGGAGGDFGAGRTGGAKTANGLEVLSDTQGVDFGPYLSRVLQAVRMNWYNLIPEAARPPLLERGKVSIEFAILPNGNVAGLRLVSPSGDVSLDRAAWGGITASNPFAPLPSEFHGPYLALRFHFYYNPQKGDMQ